MRLLDIQVEASGDRIRLSGHIEGANMQPYLAFPRTMESLVSGTADAFVPALLIPCVERGEPLEIVPPVSAQLVASLPRILDVLLALFPHFRRPKVKLHAREGKEEPSGSIVATLFSGGVDSFYTLMKGRSPEGNAEYHPTHLFFMRGLEQPLDQSAGADRTLAVVQEIADKTGIGLLWGETNLRLLFGLNYELYYNGAALAGAALALSRGIRRLLVPSSYSYGQLIPWGSHPLLDELWSTEMMEVIHHGAEARRVDKIAHLVRHNPSALQRLRVCLKNEAGPSNCGRCPKCARTMMALEVLGALADAHTFPKISRRTLMRCLRADNPIFVKELCDMAQQTGQTESLELLNRVVRSQKRRNAVKSLIETTPMLSDMVLQVNRLRRHLRGSGSVIRQDQLRDPDRIRTDA